MLFRLDTRRKLNVQKAFRWRPHCVKSVQIRSYFRSVFSCIWTEYRKIRTRNNSVFGHISRSAWTSSEEHLMYFQCTYSVLAFGAFTANIVFVKTSWRHLKDVLRRFLEDVFGNENYYVEDVFKTSSRRLRKQEMLAGLFKFA